MRNSQSMAVILLVLLSLLGCGGGSSGGTTNNRSSITPASSEPSSSSVIESSSESSSSALSSSALSSESISSAESSTSSVSSESSVSLSSSSMSSSAVSLSSSASSVGAAVYDIGTPQVERIYVSPSGSDSNTGLSESAPLQSLIAAWNRVPQGVALNTTGYHILLAPGTYPRSSLPHYLESRHGTYQHPIIIEASAGLGSVTLGGDLNMFDVRYLYLIGLQIRPVPAGDALHCESCDHILMRDLLLDGGGARVAQETLKVNQSQYIFIENSDISGAWDNAIDFVAVQHGHIIGNRVHNSGDWCHYLKGGSAYFRVEANEYFNCGVGGFTAGQGTGFQFMTSPWLHYEAYDIRFINNLVHDVEGAAIGVNGGFNVLFAHNTFYRIGERSHIFEAVAGLRSCDGQSGEPDRVRCQQYLTAGGWGTTLVSDGTNDLSIPNRDVLVFNNIFYNPAPYQSQWQHFQIFGAMNFPSSSNVPIGERGDTGLVMRGNVIWNGGGAMPLGFEDTDACSSSHTGCNAAVLQANNWINQLEPQLVSPASGNFRPQVNGNLTPLSAASIPDFTWGMPAVTPTVPIGELSNAVARNRAGENRTPSNRIGAY